MQDMSAGSLVAVTSLREFFRDAFHAASEHQHLDIDEQAEALRRQSADRCSRAPMRSTSKPPRACASSRWRTCWPRRSRRRTAQARQRALQRLGDVSLFIAGFFARSFARKLIDIDYHIAMGGNAYSSLADTHAALHLGPLRRRHLRAARRKVPAARGCPERESAKCPISTPTRTSCGCTRSG